MNLDKFLEDYRFHSIGVVADEQYLIGAGESSEKLEEARMVECMIRAAFNKFKAVKRYHVPQIDELGAEFKATEIEQEFYIFDKEGLEKFFRLVYNLSSSFPMPK